MCSTVLQWPLWRPLACAHGVHYRTEPTIYPEWARLDTSRGKVVARGRVQKSDIHETVLLPMPAGSLPEMCFPSFADKIPWF